VLATWGLCGGLATRLCGLAICFGASIVTPGSRACDMAVPLRPHNNAVAMIATAESVTRLDDILITRSPQMPSPVRPALPVPILCGEPEFPPTQHAGAVPP
jgi:hypothetical protein